MAGLELANGFHELAAADEQRARFAQDLHERKQRALPLHRMDERLLAALAAGLPDCAGVAVGFDRMLDAGGRSRPHRRGAAVSYANGIAGYCLAREMYSPVRVSTRMTSPSLMNSGTRTTAPVSSFAGF